MPDPAFPELPADLPPEYADAYRRGFARAYDAASGSGTGPGDTEAESEAGTGGADDLERLARAEAEAEVERTQRLEGLEVLLESPPRREYDGPSHRDPEVPARTGWLVPALLAGLLVVLLLGAYVAGLVFSSSVDDTDVEASEPDGVVMSEDGEKDVAAGDEDRERTPDDDAAAGERYRGRTEAVLVGGSTASCEAAASVDAAGNPVGYAPANSHDGDLTTAWRCDGDGVGQTLTLTFASRARIAELGIVPGYAKTDPRSGTDRYAENNRLTRVRWTFPDGTSLVQRLDGSATNRDLQTVRIPVTSAGEVTLEVLESTPGSRNTIAVSEVRIGAPAG